MHDNEGYVIYNYTMWTSEDDMRDFAWRQDV